MSFGHGGCFCLVRQDIRTGGAVEKRVVDTCASLPISSLGAVQSLADHDPDSAPLIWMQYIGSQCLYPLTGLGLAGLARGGERPLVIPPRTFVPYNAQATLHVDVGLWATLLPLSVHGRVSDIWRGYIAQRLFWDVGLSLAFVS